jgi:hypothetical protein
LYSIPRKKDVLLPPRIDQQIQETRTAFISSQMAHGNQLSLQRMEEQLWLLPVEFSC